MTTDEGRDVIAEEGGAGREVRCPECMNLTVWPSGDFVYRWSASDGTYVRVELVGQDERKRAEARRRGYQPCEHSLGADGGPHYLPANYAEYDDPLVIGLVGDSQSGKTHLLTAMIREVLRGKLSRYDLQAEPLDLLRHQKFHLDFLERFERGAQLPGTGKGMVKFAESLLIEGPAGKRPVVFFDVAGEDLTNVDDRERGGRFLVAADAILFVHSPEDPLSVRERAAQFGERRTDPAEALRLSLVRIKAAVDAHRLPAAVVVMKADRLRYQPPADFWLRRGSETELNAARMRAESKDVFAYLYQAGQAAAIAPFTTFDRCTLHFASASGGDVSSAPDPGDDGDRAPAGMVFSRGVRPIRVLEPLVSILAMAGVIVGPDAQQVGMP